MEVYLHFQRAQHSLEIFKGVFKRRKAVEDGGVLSCEEDMLLYSRNMENPLPLRGLPLQGGELHNTPALKGEVDSNAKGG